MSMNQSPLSAETDLPRPAIQPMFDRVLVLPDPIITQIGGIMLPNQSQAQRSTGRVVAIGEGRLCPTLQSVGGERVHVEPLRVAMGDHVFYNNYSGVGIQDDPEVEGQNPVQYLLIQEDDILCILDRPSTTASTQPATTPESNCRDCGRNPCACNLDEPETQPTP